MKLSVDRNACEANAVCCGLVPEAFELGDDDVVQIKLPEPPPELVGRLYLAVSQCPRLALSLEES